MTTHNGDLSSLLRFLTEVTPRDTSCGVAPIEKFSDAELIGGERALSDAMGHLRRRTFRAGRALLRQLADTDEPVLSEPHGAPRLASGQHATLAHDANLVVALVSPPGAPILGVDIEPRLDDRRAVEELADVVFSPNDDQLDPLHAFVAKEAVYKAWSRPDRDIIGFTDVSLRHEGRCGSYDRYTAHVEATGEIIEVAMFSTTDRVIAVATSEHAAPPGANPSTTPATQ